jgi:hypothetical protein
MIITKSSTPITKAQEAELTRAYGEAITLLPGKSEEWLMLSFEENARLAFRGKSDRPLCYVEVNLLGKAPHAAYDKLTARICELVEQLLNVPQDGTYVKYEEISLWGWNSQNF